MQLRDSFKQRYITLFLNVFYTLPIRPTPKKNVIPRFYYKFFFIEENVNKFWDDQAQNDWQEEDMII